MNNNNNNNNNRGLTSLDKTYVMEQGMACQQFRDLTIFSFLTAASCSRCGLCPVGIPSIAERQFGFVVMREL